MRLRVWVCSIGNTMCIMSHESTIRDLRAKARQLEGQKRELDKQVEAIHSTIRIFEQNDSSIEVIPTTSPYAETLTKTMCDILSEEGGIVRSSMIG